MITIMHLLSMNSLSGAEKVAINIINHLESEEFHFIYVSPDGPIRKVLQDEKIDFISINKLNIFEVNKVIKQIKPNLIHAHDNRASVFAALSIHSVPIISHLHSNPSWMNKICFKTIIYRLCVNRFKSILTVSKSISENFLAIQSSNKVLNIYNPISSKFIMDKASEFIPEKSDIVFCGRLSTVKKPILFLEIVNEIKKTHNDIKACVIGDGELRNECEKYIAANNLENNIKMIGFVINPYPYIKQSHILCSTSDYEGFGLVAAEAMCLGLPVISTYSGGVQEINKDWVTGFNCINKEDCIESVNKLLTDDNLFNQMSYQAKLHMLEFEEKNNYYKKIKDIYLDTTC